MNRENYIAHPFRGISYQILNGSGTSSIHSKYIPFYCLNGSNTITIGDDANHLLIYGLPLLEHSNHVFTNQNFQDCINGEWGSFVRFVNKGGTEIYAGKGAVFDKDRNILFMIAADNNDVLDAKLDKIFLSLSIYDPMYRTLYKNLFENTILPALKEGVKMETMSSQEIFKTIFVPVREEIDRFESIEEYANFLKTELTKEFYTNEELLIPVSPADIEEKRDYIESDIYRETGKILTPNSLQKVVDAIKELAELPENIFKPVIDIISEYMSNTNLMALEYDEEFERIEGVSTNESPY